MLYNHNPNIKPEILKILQGKNCLETFIEIKFQFQSAT